jgi:hypothetical protein
MRTSGYFATTVQRAWCSSPPRCRSAMRAPPPSLSTSVRTAGVPIRGPCLDREPRADYEIHRLGGNCLIVRCDPKPPINWTDRELRPPWPRAVPSLLLQDVFQRKVGIFDWDCLTRMPLIAERNLSSRHERISAAGPRQRNQRYNSWSRRCGHNPQGKSRGSWSGPNDTALDM